MCISFHRVYKATVYKIRRLLLFRLISDRVVFIVQFFFSIVCMLLVSVMIFMIFIVVICGNNIHG